MLPGKAGHRLTQLYHIRTSGAGRPSLARRLSTGLLSSAKFHSQIQKQVTGFYPDDLRITSALLYQLSHVGVTASLRSANTQYTERCSDLQ